MEPAAVGVLGMGVVGRAVAARLECAGFRVVSGDRDREADVVAAADGVLITTLTHGAEVADVLRRRRVRAAAMLDLTTQSPASTEDCRAIASAATAYSGGGLTGGARQVANGSAVLLLGPPPPAGASGVCAALGRVIGFPSPSSAALAKLLHNWVLLVQQWAAAVALAEADAQQVRNLPEVLASGTAGRPVPDWSMIRDHLSTYRSTYQGRLVHKDLRELAIAAPVVRNVAAPMLELLSCIFTPDDQAPYTATLEAHMTSRDIPVAALTPPELEVWQRLKARFGELIENPSAGSILTWYGLSELPGTTTPRLCDLAAAVHHMENALDEKRTPLLAASLMEPDDVIRHPGFDGFEQEILDEEELLLEIRESIRHG